MSRVLYRMSREISFTSFLVDYSSVSNARLLCVAHISRKCMRRVAIFLCPFQKYLPKQNFQLVWQMLISRSYPNLYGKVNYTWQPKSAVGVNGLILMTRSGNANACGNTILKESISYTGKRWRCTIDIYVYIAWVAIARSKKNKNDKCIENII